MKKLTPQWCPWHMSFKRTDLGQVLSGKFKQKGLWAYVALSSAWQQPEAETTERNKVEGYYRRPSFNFIAKEFGLGPKETAKVLLFLDGYGEFEIDKEDKEFLKEVKDTNSEIGARLSHKKLPENVETELQRQSHNDQESPPIGSASEQNVPKSFRRVGIFWPKLLQFREECFPHRERERKKEKERSFQTQSEEEYHPTQPGFTYVLNEESGEYDRVPVAESKLRESLDANRCQKAC